ncbi:MAG: hypothetical protein ACKV19_19070 [Verrucomicrobiales bacterium]
MRVSAHVEAGVLDVVTVRDGHHFRELRFRLFCGGALLLEFVDAGKSANDLVFVSRECLQSARDSPARRLAVASHGGESCPSRMTVCAWTSSPANH